MEPEQQEMTKKKQDYPSKQYEQCGHKNCNQNVRRDNIKNHQAAFGHPFIPRGTQRIDSMFRSDMSGTSAKTLVDDHQKRQEAQREKERLEAIKKQEQQRRELEEAEKLKAKLKKAEEERKEREAAAAERIRQEAEEKKKKEMEQLQAMELANAKASLEQEANLLAENAAKAAEKQRLEKELVAHTQTQLQLEEKAERLRAETEAARKVEEELRLSIEKQKQIEANQKVDLQVAAEQSDAVNKKIKENAETISRNTREAFSIRKELATTVQIVKSLQNQLKELVDITGDASIQKVRDEAQNKHSSPTSGDITIEPNEKRRWDSPGSSPAKKRPNTSIGLPILTLPTNLASTVGLSEYNSSTLKTVIYNPESGNEFENAASVVQVVPENLPDINLDKILDKYLNEARQNILRDSKKICASSKIIDSPNRNGGQIPETSNSQSMSEITYNTNVEDYNKRKQTVKYATSVEDILSQLPHYKLKYANATARLQGTPNGIECGKCADPNDQRAGKFAYNCTIPEVAVDGKMSEHFSNLKKHLLRHEDSPIHKEKIEQQIKDESYVPSDKEREAAINCGMAAYKCIINHKSQLEYESEIAHMAACGANVGQLNHSRKFVSQITPSLSEELKQKLIDRLNTPLPATGRPSPVSVVADKVTLNHRTWQPTGVNALVKGELKTLLIDIPVVKDHSGKGCAEELKTSLEKVLAPEVDSHGDVTRNILKERFVGGSMDGQYIRNNVGIHLSNKILGSSENYEAGKRSAPPPANTTGKTTKSGKPEQVTGFHGFNWDAAHLVENAELHAREDKKIGKPIRDVQKTIKEIQRDSTYGKSFEQLVNEQAANSKSVRSPLAFSETKFTGHCSNVLENANHNFPGHYDMLTKNNDSRAEKINNADYIMNSSGVRDAYSLMQKVSKEVQRPDAMCWQVDKSIKNAVDDMRKMSVNLTAHNYNAPNLSKFNDAANQLCKDGLYQQKPILDSKYQNIGTRQQDEPNPNFQSAIHKSAAKIAEFDNKFADELETRYTKYKPVVNDLVGATFSREQIVERGSSEIPSELHTYSDLAKEAGHMSSTVTNTQLDQQYRHFAGEIIRRSAENPKQSEQGMYKDFFNDGTQRDKCGDVAHLLAGGIVRTCNEAVVESMASVAKKHMDNRGNLSPETFNHEMNLHWNGPKVGENCKPLVEQGLRRHFNGENFRFYRKCEETRPDKIQRYTTSKVVDRKNSETGRIPFD